MASLLDSIPNDECYTIEDLAAEFRLGELRMRQVVDKAVKEKIVQNLVKKEGRRILYTPQMVEQLKNAYDSGKLGKFQKRTIMSSIKKAELVVTVPIFDPEIAQLLKKKYEKEDDLIKFAKSKLEESVKPILLKKRELEERYNKELQKLFHSIPQDVNV